MSPDGRAARVGALVAARGRHRRRRGHGCRAPWSSRRRATRRACRRSRDVLVDERVPRVPGPAAPRRPGLARCAGRRPRRLRRQPGRDSPARRRRRPPRGARVRSTSRAARRGAVAATGATVDGPRRQRAATAAAPVVARATGALAPGARRPPRAGGAPATTTAVSSLTPCSQPAADVWLVGGGAGPSRTERIVVEQPGRQRRDRRLRRLRRQGHRVGGGAQPLHPAARAQSCLARCPRARRAASPAVHVIATGGVVVGRARPTVDRRGDGARHRRRDACSGTGDRRRWWRVSRSAARPPCASSTPPTVGRRSSQVTVLTGAGPSQPRRAAGRPVPPGATLDVPLALAAGRVRPADQLGPARRRAAAWTERRAATADRMGDFGWAAGPARHPRRGGRRPARPSSRTQRLLLSAGGPGLAPSRSRSPRGPERRTRDGHRRARLDGGPALGDADRVWVSTRGGDIRAAATVVGAEAGVPLRRGGAPPHRPRHRRCRCRCARSAAEPV